MTNKEKDFWFYENSSRIEPLHTKNHWKVKNILFSGRSEYQKIDFFDTYDHGILFALDNIVMCTERDEFIYHEIISHVPLFSHYNPKSVLIIGGGDGGVLVQLIKHRHLENIELCEIDSLVLQKCEEFFPYIGIAKKDSRVKIHVEDGAKFLDNKKDSYDIIIVDSTDEDFSKSQPFFTKNFFEKIYLSLKQDGIFSMQVGSPFYNKNSIQKLKIFLNTVFPISKIFAASCHSYPGGYWGFFFGSKKYNYTNFQENLYQQMNIREFKYYNKNIHFSAFHLPNYFLI